MTRFAFPLRALVLAVMALAQASHAQVSRDPIMMDENIVTLISKNNTNVPDFRAGPYGVGQVTGDALRSPDDDNGDGDDGDGGNDEDAAALSLSSPLLSPHSSITPPSPPPKNETGCASHADCRSCSASSWKCHWCAHDELCHAVGSVHGCLRGQSCDPPPPPPSEKDDSRCASHSDCVSCSSSSWGCHWCAHDNSCHAVGSIHGCVAGVNCYSNDRCARAEPEPIRGRVFGRIGLIPALVIAAAGLLFLGCATACVGVVGCVAEAFDDLSALAVGEEEAGADERMRRRRRTTRRNRRRDWSRREPPRMGVNHFGGQAMDDVALMPPSTGEWDDEEDCHNGTSGRDEAEEPRGATNATDENDALTSNADDERHDDEGRSPLIGSGHGESEICPRRRPRSKAARFYDGCKICYTTTVVAVVMAVGMVLVCFPKAPEYNVCNDEFSWRSIVDGMTSMKAQASFQLLMSVENPNYMSAELESGSGSFKHDGVEVGTFEISATAISAMSISDVLVVITFAPDKWEALALTTEYYRGTLKFSVDATVMATIPLIGGYTLSGGISNYIVHVNDPKLQDRHLCACPQWKDK